MDYSKIPAISLKGLSDKDKGLIKDNPETSLQGLMVKGLSTKAEKLLKSLEDGVTVVKPSKLIAKKTTIARPTGAPRSGSKRGNESVQFHNHNTGLTVSLNRKHAERLIKMGQYSESQGNPEKLIGKIVS